MRFGRRLGAGVIVWLLMAGTGRAQDDWTNTRDSFICRSNTEVREIKTYISAPPTGSGEGMGCRVDYIKNGATQTVWASRTSRTYCGGKAANLAARLRAGNFSCEPLHVQRSDTN